MTSHLFSMMGLRSIDAHDVRTCPQRRYEAMSKDVTWRDVKAIDWRKIKIKLYEHYLKTNVPSGLKERQWLIINCVFGQPSVTKDVVTPKVDKVDIKRTAKAALYIFMYCLKQKEKKWLIDYLYSILWYFILINFDMIL